MPPVCYNHLRRNIEKGCESGVSWFSDIFVFSVHGVIRLGFLLGFARFLLGFARFLLGVAMLLLGFARFLLGVC